MDLGKPVTQLLKEYTATKCWCSIHEKITSEEYREVEFAIDRPRTSLIFDRLKSQFSLKVAIRVESLNGD